MKTLLLGISITTALLLSSCDTDSNPVGSTSKISPAYEQDSSLLGNWKHIQAISGTMNLKLNANQQYDTTITFNTTLREDISSLYFEDIRITKDSIYLSSRYLGDYTDSLWTTDSGILSYYKPTNKKSLESHYEISGDTLKLWSVKSPDTKKAHWIDYYITTEETLEELKKTLKN